VPRGLLENEYALQPTKAEKPSRHWMALTTSTLCRPSSRHSAEALRYRQFDGDKRALAELSGKSDAQRDLLRIDDGAKPIADRLAVDKIHLEGQRARIETFAEFSEHIDG
jgi:hypothetical protein